ncbi:MAG: hypothetical protein E7425_09120 [Ruminococcaceae bacterium]|nr:hypothetical protein [Oscillospiraceae bacterium]
MKSVLEIVNEMVREDALLHDRGSRTLLLPCSYTLSVDEYGGQLCPSEDLGEANAHEAEIIDILTRFHRFCSQHGLPSHNPIAFYKAVLNREAELCVKENHPEFEWALVCALAGNGFVFGTSFDRDQRQFIRPCELIGEPANQHFLSLAYHVQATLPGAQSFYHDYLHCEKYILGQVSDGKSTFTKWVDEKDELTDFWLTEEDIEGFFAVYYDYCKRQQHLDTQQAEALRKKLLSLKKAVLFFHTACQFEGNLKRAATGDNSIESKNALVAQFSKYLNENPIETINNELEALKEKGIVAVQNVDFFRACARLTGNAETRRKYPLLDKAKPFNGLGKYEEYAFAEIKRNSVCKTILQIKEALSSSRIQKIAPYFLFWFFKNKGKPFGFVKHSADTFQKETFALDDAIHFGDDSKKQYERSHCFLYEAFCAWWENRALPRTSLKSYTRTLPDYLFGRCASIASHKEYWFWRKYGKDGAYSPCWQEVYSVGNASQQVLLRIEDTLRISDDAFLQYAWTKAEKNELSRLCDLQEKQYRSLRKVVRSLREKFQSGGSRERDREAYMNLALLSPSGIGVLLQPLSWHREMAKWLDQVILGDSQIEDYIRFDDPVFLKGTDVSPSNWNEVNRTIMENIELVDGFEQIELQAEDLRPELAEIELIVQRICYESICESLKGSIVSLYKRVLWG